MINNEHLIDIRMCRHCWKQKPLSEFKTKLTRICNCCALAAKQASSKKHRKKVKDAAKRLEYNRKWYASHKEYFAEHLKKRRRENREIALAYATLQNAVRSNKIIRPESCIKCNKTGNIQGHHGDYSKRLDVEWLCTKCHTLVHHP